MGLIDKAKIGEDEKSLYDYQETNKVREVIEDYKKIQGTHMLQTEVAGGNNFIPSSIMDAKGIDMSNPNLISSSIINYDWYCVKNYVRNHLSDGKGNLIIRFSAVLDVNGKKSTFGHVVNFLRFEVVNGQERIYVYDSNLEDKEEYFYKDTDGLIKLSGFPQINSVYSIMLCNVNLFNTFHVFDIYWSSRPSIIFAKTGMVFVEKAIKSLMAEGVQTTTHQIMYELPEDLTEVRIVPLTDHAEFTYMDQVFTIDREDENTIGILKLAETEEDTGTLTVINDPDNHVHVYEADSYTVPTCSEAGKVICKCTRCSDTYTETLDALGHYDNDDNNICDDCGKPMPPTHTPGDINGDGVVNNKDLNRLMKKLAGENVECVDAALDVNGDGVVNNKDLNRLMKKLAGENVEIY